MNTDQLKQLLNDKDEEIRKLRRLARIYIDHYEAFTGNPFELARATKAVTASRALNDERILQ